MKARDYQQQILENTFASYERGISSGIIRAFTGAGKCHGIDTPILMFNGEIKKVQDVKVGDQLMGPDSRPRNVLSLARGRERLYRVKPTKGESWVCNESHILSLVCNAKQVKHYGQVIDISIRDYLKTTDGFKHYHKLFRTGVEFPPQLVAMDPWLLGVWLGDGSSTTPLITNQDKEIQDNIDWVSKSHGWTSTRLNLQDKEKCATFYIKDGMLDTLRDLGVIGNKHIPKQYLYNDTLTRLDLLAGLLDTDGHLSHNGYEIIIKNDQFADDMVYLCRSLGLAAYKTLKKGTIKSIGFVGYYWRISISGNTDMIPCRLSYKKASERKQIKDVLRTGFTLKDLGVGDYYGFEIDGDHRYLLGCFTVTHNTVIATELARIWKENYGGKALFLVDQIDLAHQAYNGFKRQFPDMKIGMEMSASHSSGEEDIMIASVQTLSKKGSKRIEKFNPDEYTLTICDEVHKALTPSWERVLHYMGVHKDNFIDGKMLVGLSATPRRRGGSGLGKLFHDFYGNYDIIYGMREGWLVTPEWVKVKTDIDISKVKVKGDFFDDEELEEAINTEVRNKMIFKAWNDEGRGQAIVYCQSVDHAYAVAQMFKSQGVSAETIEANTNKDSRKDWLQEFREGNLEVLTNFGTLSTGIDFPELRSIIFARPIGSDILYEQILGRVLRPSQYAMVDAMPDATSRRAAISVSEKPYAKVIDLVDTTGAVRLMNPLTLLGVNDKVKTEDKVKVFEQVYEPLERAKKEHGINISEITDLGEIETIVTRTKGIDIGAPKATELYTMSDLKWFKVDQDEYELISTKENKTLVVTKNELDRWELAEYNMKSESGMGRTLNTFQTLAGALRVADEYAESFEDFKYLRRLAHQAEKPPSQKQLDFIKRLFGKSVLLVGDKAIIRGWGKRPDIHINTVEDAADVITKRLGK